MSAPQTTAEHLNKAMSVLLTETFEHVQGIFLDGGTSLFETLDGVSATVASRPVSATCATIAAHVKHVTFYLELTMRYLRHEEIGKVDWGEIWRTTNGVTPAEWDAIRAQLREAYTGVRALLQSQNDPSGEDDITNALAIIVHSAYHLGEIRQALCTVR